MRAIALQRIPQQVTAVGGEDGPSASTVGKEIVVLEIGETTTGRTHKGCNRKGVSEKIPGSHHKLDVLNSEIPPQKENDIAKSLKVGVERSPSIWGQVFRSAWYQTSK